MIVCLLSWMPVLASDLICSVKFNTQEVFETKVSVKEGQRVKFVSIENYTFFLKNTKAHDFELEVLDMDIPSRSYALASLKNGEDKLQYSLWSRDTLLETSCHRVF